MRSVSPQQWTPLMEEGLNTSGPSCNHVHFPFTDRLRPQKVLLILVEDRTVVLPKTVSETIYSYAAGSE